MDLLAFPLETLHLFFVAVDVMSCVLSPLRNNPLVDVLYLDVPSDTCQTLPVVYGTCKRKMKKQLLINPCPAE